MAPDQRFALQQWKIGKRHDRLSRVEMRVTFSRQILAEKISGALPAATSPSVPVVQRHRRGTHRNFAARGLRQPYFLVVQSPEQIHADGRSGIYQR